MRFRRNGRVALAMLALALAGMNIACSSTGGGGNGCAASAWAPYKSQGIDLEANAKITMLCSLVYRTQVQVSLDRKVCYGPCFFTEIDKSGRKVRVAYENAISIGEPCKSGTHRYRTRPDNANEIYYDIPEGRIFLGAGLIIDKELSC